MWRAGQLAVEFIGVIDLADVKLGLEGDGAALLTLTLARVCVKVIEKAEEGGEAGLRARVRVVKVASRLKNGELVTVSHPCVDNDVWQKYDVMMDTALPRILRFSELILHR
ncbi:hypothetical protein HYQ44_014840 [Verticillium longisporum]|nr:hypothetical protein HYQ44_014840 [Verticillium longisporum]